MIATHLDTFSGSCLSDHKYLAAVRRLGIRSPNNFVNSSAWFVFIYLSKKKEWIYKVA